MGKRRKRREVPDSDIMLAQSIKITDKFIFEEQNGSELSRSMILEECKTSFTAAVTAGALFLLAQVSVILKLLY